MGDSRPPFDDAKREFVGFLRSQAWPSTVLWLSKDRLAGRRRTHWVFRPEELAADRASREYYESLRRTKSSIRIDALAHVADRTLAYVEDYGGEGCALNFGVRTDTLPLRPISSRVCWVFLRFTTGFLGSSPFLNHTRLTPAAEVGQDAAGSGPAA